MPWGVRLTPAAQDDLFGFTIRESEVVSFNLFRLAEDPVQLSTPSSSFNPSGQEYQFRHVSGATEIRFTIIFSYHEHWETLLIAGIRREAAGR